MQISWLRILSNIAGAAALCYGAHAGAQAAGLSSIPAPSIFGVILCVVSNLAGLVQTPPAK